MSFSWHYKAHSNVHTRFFRSFHVSNFTVPLFHIYPPWYLMQYDWLVPSMRLQVIQDSLFSRLGSVPFSGRGRRESRNRSNKHKENILCSWRLCLSNTIRANRKRRLILQMAVHHLLARRRWRLYVCSLVMLLLSQRNAIELARVVRPRSCCRLIRNEGWWHKVWTTYSDVRFKKTLRVSREHFILF